MLNANTQLTFLVKNVGQANILEAYDEGKNANGFTFHIYWDEDDTSGRKGEFPLYLSQCKVAETGCGYGQREKT